MNTFGKFLSALLLVLSCTACTRIDPSAPLDKKWATVEKFVPTAKNYLVVVNSYALAESEFYRTLAKEDPKSIPEMLRSTGENPATGITVISDDLVFLGGSFDPKELSQKITASIVETGGQITEEKLNGKTLFFDKRTKAAFVFLKPYLLVQGDETKLREMVQKSIEKPANTIETNHSIFAKFISPKQINAAMSELIISVDAGKTLKVAAYATFADENEAKSFYDEAQGYKTLKTIQSIDEPWISDAIDAIGMKQEGKLVKFEADLETRPAKSLLRLFTK